MIRPIPYEIPRLLDQGMVEASHGKALSLNISSGGMLLLVDRPLEVQQVLKVQVPTPMSTARTPTLAEVRWTRPVPMATTEGIGFVGVKFLI